MTALGALTVLLALAVAVIGSTSHLRTLSWDRLDDELAATVAGLTPSARKQVVRVERGKPPFRYPGITVLPTAEVSAPLGELVAPNGRVLPLPRFTRSDRRYPRPPADLAERADTGPFTMLTAEGEFRAIARSLRPTGYVIFVTASTAPTRAALASQVRTELVAALVLFVVFGALLAFGVWLSLRPLRDLEDLAGRIAAGDHTERAPDRGTGTEIGRLTAATNQMLDALEESMRTRDELRARTERFAAEAAHELRTPVTTVLGYAQLLGRGEIAPDEVSAVADRIEHEAQRLRHLVDSLLFLNRLEMGAFADDAAWEPVDLADLCRECASDSMTIDASHPIEVVVDGVDAPVVTTVRPLVFQVIAALLDNVRRHTPPGTTTRIRFAGRAGTPSTGRAGEVEVVTVSVVDDGPGLAPEARARAAEQLRVGARGGDRSAPGGVGLGLAIVASIVRGVGGEIAFGDVEQGTAIDVVLPVDR